MVFMDYISVDVWD